MYGLSYGFQDTMNFIFFSVVSMSFSPRSAMHVCFKGFLSDVDLFSLSGLWLPGYHKLNIWL